MSATYSDELFDQVMDEIEQLLADLMGIEAAAKAVRDYALDPKLDEQGVVQTTYQLTLSIADPFEVYPTLPLESLSDEPDYYQTWIDGHVAYGQSTAGGTSAWLKTIVDNYYLVDTDTLISEAIRQGEVALDQGTQLDQDFVDVSGNLAVHWEGEAKEEFFEWFASAAAVASVLFHYANAAQVAAGASGDVIAATQKAMLKQAEKARDTLAEAIAAWRADFDVFPFPPGSGYLFSQIGSAIGDKIDEYTEKIPGPDVLVDIVVGKAIGKGVSKVPGLSQTIASYDLITQLEVKNVDPATPKTAQEILDLFEGRLRTIAKDGDDGLERLSTKISALADEVASTPVFRLPRLPRAPEGTYTS